MTVRVLWKSIRTIDSDLKIDSNNWQYSDNRFEPMKVLWQSIPTTDSTLKNDSK